MRIYKVQIKTSLGWLSLILVKLTSKKAAINAMLDVKKVNPHKHFRVVMCEQTETEIERTK